MLEEVYKKLNTITNVSGIYCITNIVSNKIYIGSSKHIDRRIKEHIRKLRKGTHANSHLQSAWNLHKENAFIFLIIEKCDTEELLIREQYYIDKYKCYDKSVGYNKSITANGGTPIPRTHCSKGHELDEKNLILYRGERKCRACNKEKWKKSYIKKPRIGSLKKDFCLKGHALTEDNIKIYYSKNKSTRYCKICLERKRKEYADNKKNGTKCIKLPKSHCSKGHLLLSSNLYIEKTGRKRCLICLKNFRKKKN